ncbi:MULTISPECIES: D-2-hydroxyacid dehydrogenase [unclassified Luteococcus]|uniref:D-2-hydroxyacid dehydrogenase n=1 Tax=unclassified Luteococcus TaxID=2639923 RepID=UPI00313B75B7
MSLDHLRVAVVTPLTQEHADLISAADPRIEVVLEPELIPPMRFPGDHNGDPAFSRTPEQQRRFEALCDSADALYGIPDTNPAALARTVAANPSLKWVHTMAAGGGSQVKAAQLPAEQLERVAFTTSAGAHSQTLAEFAVFGVMCGAKDLPRLQVQQHNRFWSDRWAMKQVFQMTVLVVGMGHIGRDTAVLFSKLGAHVIGVNRTVRQVEGVEEVFGVERLAEVAGQADAIINCLPEATDTTGLISAEVLAAVKPGAIFVSTGRGTCVDEAALTEALADGRISFAALDVFAVEPLPQDSPLWAMDNVVIAPHTGALNDQEDRLIAELFAENARRLLNGEELVNPVDKVKFY